MSIAKHTKTVKWQESSSVYTFLSLAVLTIKSLKFEKKKKKEFEIWDISLREKITHLEKCHK